MNRRPLLVLALLAFAAMTAFGLTLPTLSYLAQDFGASDFQVGLLGACYFGMQFLFAPVWGAASDRVGRKPLLVLGLAGYGSAFLLAGVSSSLYWLYAGKLLAGIVGTATLPSVRAAVADVTSDADRGKGMGLIGACIGLGFVFGPGLAFGLIHGLGPTETTPEALIALHKMPMRVASGLAFAGILLVPLLVLPAAAAHAGAREGSFGALLRATRGPIPHIYLTALLATFALAALEAALPLYVKARFGGEVLPASFLARAFVVMGITGVIVQGGLVPRLIGGLGETRTAAAGLVFAMIGFGSVPMFSSPGRLLIALAILAVGTGLVRPSISTLISRRTTGGQGGALGSLDAFESIGRAGGNPVGGALHGHSHFAPFAMSSALAAVALLPLLAGGFLVARPVPAARQDPAP